MDAEVLAISVDSIERNKKLAADMKLGYWLLADPDLKVIDAYGVRHKGAGVEAQNIARPATFLIDREGMITWRDLTENWRIRPRPERILKELAETP